MRTIVRTAVIATAIMDGTRNVLVLIADDRTFPLPLGLSELLLSFTTGARGQIESERARVPANAEPAACDELCKRVVRASTKTKEQLERPRERARR